MMIDVFNHFMPKAYLDRLGTLIPGHVVLTAFPRLKTLWDVDARLALLEKFDGLQQVLSLANPPLELIAPPDKTPELARMANDALAELCRRHADRFPAFIAALPMNNIDATLAEIDRAVNDLGARGVQLFTNVGGKPLSAPEFRPIFRRMVAHDLPVWLHPMRGPNFPDYASEQTSEAEIWFSFGWPYETSACVTRLIYSRLFDELPALKIITHHMGGMIPYFAGKINLGFRRIFFGTPERNPAAEDAGLKKPVMDYFKGQEPPPAVRAAHGAEGSLGAGRGERAPGAAAVTQSAGGDPQISRRRPCLRAPRRQDLREAGGGPGAGADARVFQAASRRLIQNR